MLRRFLTPECSKRAEPATFRCRRIGKGPREAPCNESSAEEFDSAGLLNANGTLACGVIEVRSMSAVREEGECGYLERLDSEKGIVAPP